MSKTKKILIIAHTPSKNTQEMCNALLAGANEAQSHDSDCHVIAHVKSPFDCTSEDVLVSDGVILFTTENFGYMSGALKDFFDRSYYGCLDEPKRNDATPFCLVIKAGLDGTGTNIAVHKITTGLKWREARPVTLCKGPFEAHFLSQCHELGLAFTMSLGLDLI